MIGLVLAAAGSGQRFGSEIPKQFLEIDGFPVFFQAFLCIAPFCLEHVIVASGDQQERVQAFLKGEPRWRQVRVVHGGATRQESVRMGVLSLPSGVERVLVHDAARPFVSRRLVERVLQTLERAPACVPALPVAETVKEVRGTRIVRTLDRSRLVLVQTPQGFHRRALEKALEWARQEGVQGTDEASLLEQMGETVEWVEGDRANLKITWPGDLEAGRHLWQNRGSDPI